MLSHHLILSCPLLLPPLIFPSIKVFSNELAHNIRWPKHWSFSFNISPSKKIQGLFPLELAGLISRQPKGTSTVFSSTQLENISSSALRLLMVQFSHLYMKNCTFDYMDICWQNNVSLFNMLSRFAIAFLAKSKHL